MVRFKVIDVDYVEKKDGGGVYEFAPRPAKVPTWRERLRRWHADNRVGIFETVFVGIGVAATVFALYVAFVVIGTIYF